MWWSDPWAKIVTYESSYFTGYFTGTWLKFHQPFKINVCCFKVKKGNCLVLTDDTSISWDERASKVAWSLYYTEITYTQPWIPIKRPNSLNNVQTDTHTKSSINKVLRRCWTSTKVTGFRTIWFWKGEGRIKRYWIRVETWPHCRVFTSEEDIEKSDIWHDMVTYSLLTGIGTCFHWY